MRVDDTLGSEHEAFIKVKYVFLSFLISDICQDSHQLNLDNQILKYILSMHSLIM